MPWCPICKNEYVDGITECSDCKVPLVDSLDEINPPVITGNQQEMERLLAFLEYSKFKDIKINHNEENDEYEIYCKEKDVEKVKRASTIFYQQESLRKPELLKEAENVSPETILGENTVTDLYSGNVESDFYEAEESLEEASEEICDDTIQKDSSSRHESLKPYQKKSEKAADFKSSGMTLIPLGVLGIAALICIELGILPIHLAAPGKYLTYSVMGALFFIFIVVGFFSLKSSKKYAQDAKEEDEFIENLKIWAKETIHADQLLQNIFITEPDIQEELIYFKVSDLLKSIITAEYFNLDDAFLEEFIDTLYHDEFEQKVTEHFGK